jgi:hypothetical protein
MAQFVLADTVSTTTTRAEHSGVRRGTGRRGGSRAVDEALMSRGRQPFRQTDVVKAIRAAAQAGLPVARFEIDRDGKIIVIAGRPEQDDASPLEQWRRERGQG